jgi:hypothetical protein
MIFDSTIRYPIYQFVVEQLQKTIIVLNHIQHCADDRCIRFRYLDMVMIVKV